MSRVSQAQKRLSKRAGVKGRSNPHAFRHRLAIDYLMHGGNLGSLADLLGHNSVETAKDFYVVFEEQDLRRKHDQFSGARWGENV